MPILWVTIHERYNYALKTGLKIQGMHLSILKQLCNCLNGVGVENPPHFYILDNAEIKKKIYLNIKLT